MPAVDGDRRLYPGRSRRARRAAVFPAAIGWANRENACENADNLLFLKEKLVGLFRQIQRSSTATKKLRAWPLISRPQFGGFPPKRGVI